MRRLAYILSTIPGIKDRGIPTLFLANQAVTPSPYHIVPYTRRITTIDSCARKALACRGWERTYICSSFSASSDMSWRRLKLDRQVWGSQICYSLRVCTRFAGCLSSGTQTKEYIWQHPDYSNIFFVVPVLLRSPTSCIQQEYWFDLESISTSWADEKPCMEGSKVTIQRVDFNLYVSTECRTISLHIIISLCHPYIS